MRQSPPGVAAPVTIKDIPTTMDHNGNFRSKNAAAKFLGIGLPVFINRWNSGKRTYVQLTTKTPLPKKQQPETKRMQRIIHRAFAYPQSHRTEIFY